MQHKFEYINQSKLYSITVLLLHVYLYISGRNAHPNLNMQLHLNFNGLYFSHKAQVIKQQKVSLIKKVKHSQM